MLERFLNPNLLFRTLIVAVLLRGALYTFVVPPWQHPDEPTHFEHVRLITDLGILPEIEDISIPLRREIAISMAAYGFWNPNPAPEITDSNLDNPGISLLGIYTLTHPRLYYRFAATWLRPWLGLSIEGQLFAVRLLGVFLNLVVALAAFKTAQMLFSHSKWIAPAVMGFVVFHPGNTDIMSAVNNDVLVNALGAIIFYTLAVIFMRGFTLINGMGLLILLVAAVFTKTTAFILLASLPIGLIFFLLHKNRKAFAGAVVLSIFMAVFAILFLLQNEGIAGLAEGAMGDLGRYFRVNVTQTFENLAYPETTQFAVQALPIIYQSFWVIYGWRHILLAAHWYWAPGLFAGLALAGLGKRLRQWLASNNWRGELDRRSAYLGFAFFVILIAAAITLFRSLVTQGLRPYLSHGRYMYVALIPIGIVFVWGLLGWLKRPLPQASGGIFFVSVIAFDAIAFWGYLVPFYY